ncbi:MAG: Signal transduction histidine kinase [Burkholderiales bacterium RIFCSPLOWO2_02_FULL_57_36]|nr:MAG: Signal transduction histidine kinase [Burkholderiales bacterium RIFCSPLOWO2_02_FULL_57_36]
MPIRTVLLLIVAGAIAVFAALNWSAFMAPTTLSLGVTDIQAPLGLVMLGLIVLLTMLFLVFVVYLQTSVLLEARRHAKELQVNRELADQAEASRFTDLRGYLEAELQRVAERDTETRTAVLGRLDEVDGNLRGMIEQSGNTLAAYIGELEDRLDRSMQGQGPNRLT